MTWHLTRALAVSALLLLASGCKLILINPEGGLMASTSGTRDCRAPTVCTFEITDATFDETWTAVPDPLWEFVRWSDGTDFVCAGSTNPVCSVSSVGTTGDPLAEAIIASNKSYYMMPVFQLAAPQPITQTITLQGIEWAQPSLFTNLTWDEIDAVCPGGVCSGGLNGHLMDGWTFATVDDVNAVFNFYLLAAGSGTMGPGPTVILAPLDTLAAMWEAGWNMTCNTPEDGIFGRTITPSGSEHYLVGAQENTIVPPFSNPVDLFAGLTFDDTPGTSCHGAWFYRIPPP